MCSDNPHAASRPRGRHGTIIIKVYRTMIIILYYCKILIIIHNNNYCAARECPETSDGQHNGEIKITLAYRLLSLNAILHYQRMSTQVSLSPPVYPMTIRIQAIRYDLCYGGPVKSRSKTHNTKFKKRTILEGVTCHFCKISTDKEVTTT